MKNIFFIILLISLHSCSDDILDLKPSDRVAESAVWSDAVLIKAYHNAIYNGIGTEKSRNMLAKACDEMTYTGNNYPGPILKATSTADNISNRIGFGGSGSIYTWNLDYDVIRQVVEFIDRMETNRVLPDAERTTLVAEARVIRAYMYFRLIIRYGGVPIIEDLYGLDNIPQLSRSSMDACVAYIEADIAAAMPNLPDVIHASDANFGRMNKSAAKAILSRMYLYLASPLFNPTNDQAKWKKASDAAFDLIDDGFFTLHADYTTLFNQKSGAANNEIIWGRNYTASNSHSQPMIFLDRRWGGYGGWSATGGPSQNLVDDYDMKTTGEPAFNKVNHVSTTVNLASGYNPQNPYADRDPRFYSTVIYDGTEFRGITYEKWVASNGATFGFDSWRQSGDNPRCNYVMRKFMPGLDTEPEMNWSLPYTTPYIAFRLGEIYLNYAEAMFEQGNEQVCRDYINLVRARGSVNMPPIPNTVTGENLRTRLYNERRIELALEGHRYFDVRRWGIAKYTEVKSTYGMDIIKDVNTGIKTYTPIVINTRAWNEKLNFIPIATDEYNIIKNTVTQTPGYE